MDARDIKVKQKINWDKYFNRNKPKQKSPLDINELFPGYFNKNVFRGVIIVLFLLATFTMYSNDWQISFNYVECPVDVLTGCDFLTYSNSSLSLENIHLKPGEILGSKPNNDFYAFPSRSKALVFLGFVFNHLYYFFRSKSFKIPFNKLKWYRIMEDIKKDEN